jgi:hypothetical protein
MGRFAPKLSDGMRAAIRAAAAEGRTGPEIVGLAAAGGLGGLASFDVSESTVREVAGEAERDPTARSSRVAQPAPVDAIATRAQAILEHEMDRLEGKSKHGLKTQDASALKRLLQVAREIKAIQLGFIPPGPRTTRLLDGHGQPHTGNGGEERSPVLDRMLGLEAIESESAARH